MKQMHPFRQSSPIRARITHRKHLHPPHPPSISASPRSITAALLSSRALGETFFRHPALSLVVNLQSIIVLHRARDVVFPVSRPRSNARYISHRRPPARAHASLSLARASSRMMNKPSATNRPRAFREVRAVVSSADARRETRRRDGRRKNKPCRLVRSFVRSFVVVVVRRRRFSFHRPSRRVASSAAGARGDDEDARRDAGARERDDGRRETEK